MAEVQIRMATTDDAGIFARHRGAMYEDMGLLPHEATEGLQASSEEFFRSAIAGGRWFGWLAMIEGQSIGGAVMHLDEMPPRNGPGHVFIPAKLQGLIMNVYVEPDQRRGGVASLLMDAMLAFAKSKGAASVTLHASQKGKPLYEKMGFAPTHEMRLFL